MSKQCLGVCRFASVVDLVVIICIFSIILLPSFAIATSASCCVGDCGSGDGNGNGLGVLFSNCPHLSPSVYSPTCTMSEADDEQEQVEALKDSQVQQPSEDHNNNSNHNNDYQCRRTAVAARLQLDRFNDIVDQDETLSVSGSVRFWWPIDCDTSTFTNKNNSTWLDFGGNHFKIFNGSMVKLLPCEMWQPEIYLANAIDSISLRAPKFTSRFYAKLKQGQWSVKQQFYGKFIISCQFDYWQFPFDRQSCSLVFRFQEDDFATGFDSLEFRFNADWIDSDDGWDFLESRHDLFNESDKHSTAEFKLTFQRRPEFFISTIAVPVGLMTGLALLSLLLPTTANADRPAFAVTLLLALTVMQEQILSRIPVKPGRIFLVNYTDFCSVLAWLCTVHAIATFYMHSIGKCSKRVDRAVCILLTAAFVAINAYAIVVAFTPS